MTAATRLARYQGGIPVYRYVVDPSTPPVLVHRLHRRSLRESGRTAHAHDFPALAYFERDGGTVFPGESPVRAGDLFVAPPGAVMDPDAEELADARASVVFFMPEVLDRDRPEPLAGWRAHPLLFPFVGGTARGALRLRVPEDQRADWARGITAIETELARRQEGYRQAVVAELVLLLVRTARLAADVPEQPRHGDDTLTRVFAVIERGYRDGVSLRDVARAVSLTPGHLTTVVRQRTGRTVQEWIVERRMTEARRLLEESALPIGEVSRRVGVDDPSYFTRAFRRHHGMSPRTWRERARRPAG